MSAAAAAAASSAGGGFGRGIGDAGDAPGEVGDVADDLGGEVLDAAHDRGGKVRAGQGARPARGRDGDGARGGQRFARRGGRRGAAGVGRVVTSPPHRHVDRAGEGAAGAIVVVLVEHGPFEILVELLALDLGRAIRLHLRPGFFHDGLVIFHRLFAAETFHLVGDRAHESDGHALQQIAARGGFCLAESFQEILFVLVKFGRLFFGKGQFERVARDHLRGALFDDAEQDHGHHLVKRLFHQDGGLDRGQSALDAVSLDGNFGRQVFQFAALSLHRADDGHANEHEREESAAKDSGQIADHRSDQAAKIEGGRGDDGRVWNVCLWEGRAEFVLLGYAGAGVVPRIRDAAFAIQARLRLGGESRWRIMPARLLSPDSRRQVEGDG